MKNIKLKPCILISKCIEHGHCRYDKSQISSSFVKKLEKYVDIITVCPEVAIGLPIPRQAIRIIDENNKKKLVFSMTGEDVTSDMIEFSKKFLNEKSKTKIHGFILKSRSPTCGIKDVKVYKTIGKAPSTGEKTIGFFAKSIVEKYKGIAIEDEGRLTNYNIREHFLTRIYVMTRFDEVIESNSMSKLIEFHSQNKYLLMAYHQKLQKELGKIVANHEKIKTNKVIKEYYELLKDALAKPLRRGTNMNMLMHLFGYFKKELSKEEKAYFLDVLEQYSLKKIPFSVPISLIYSWVIRFDEQYLKAQTIFEPYPKEILDVTDSGKGIL